MLAGSKSVGRPPQGRPGAGLETPSSNGEEGDHGLAAAEIAPAAEAIMRSGPAEVGSISPIAASWLGVQLRMQRRRSFALRRAAGVG